MTTKRTITKSKQEKKVNTDSRREDSWGNILTGVGTSSDKRTFTKFTAKNLMTEYEIHDLFTDEGLGRKIVTKPVDAMIRAWFTLSGGEDNIDSKIQTIFDNLRLRKYLKELLYLNKAYGGAVMVLGINDGNTSEEAIKEPLQEDKIRSIDFLKVYDRYRVVERVYNKDKKSENFGELETIRISPTGGTPFIVHASRCLILEGIFTPDFVKQLNLGWGTSVYQYMYEQLRDIGDTFTSIGHIIESFNTSSISMKNLLQMIMSGRDDIIKARLNYMDLSKHIMNTVLLDADQEVYNKHAGTLAGLPETLDRQMQFLSSVSGCPVSVLFGRSAAGMNATGENDIREWYDSIDEERKDTFLFTLERLIKLCMLCKDYEFKGSEPQEWFVNFNSLYQRTANEEADLRFKNMQTDTGYIDRNVYDPEEVRMGRFQNGKYIENFSPTDQPSKTDRKEKEEEEE
jgi:phage-related protein (TIGR01555 family)